MAAEPRPLICQHPGIDQSTHERFQVALRWDRLGACPARSATATTYARCPLRGRFSPFGSLAPPVFRPTTLHQPDRSGLIQFQDLAGLKCGAFFRISYLFALPLDTALFDEPADIASGTV